MVKLITLVQTFIVIYNPWSTQTALGSQWNNLNSHLRTKKEHHIMGTYADRAEIQCNPMKLKKWLLQSNPCGQHFIIYLHHGRIDMAPAM